MIPKVIHYCWFGRNPKPKLAEKCIKSWKKYCPDYKIVEWNEDNYDYTAVPFMREAYESKKWGFVPDYARYDIIYKNGGIYLDLDVELLKPLDELLNNKGYVGIDSEQYLAFGSGFGAEAGNETLKLIRDRYLQDTFILEDGTLNLLPAPKKDTALLMTMGYLQENKKQNVGDFVIFPADFFDPMSFKTRKLSVTNNTFSIHWYSASWVDEYQRRRIHHPRLFHAIDGAKMTVKKVIGEKSYLWIKRIWLRLVK